MKIEFIENHPIGIKKGHIAEMADVHAQRMIGEGYALPFDSVQKKDKKKGKKKHKK